MTCDDAFLNGFFVGLFISILTLVVFSVVAWISYALGREIQNEQPIQN